MVNQEKLHQFQIPIQAEIIKRIFSHIPEETVISRESKTGIMVSPSEEIFHNKYCINTYLKFDKYNEYIAEFFDVLDSNFGHCNLSNFYNNFKTLSIIERRTTIYDLIDLLLTGFSSAAEYDQHLNTMYLVDKSRKGLKNIIGHELLHMSSSKETEDLVCVGFHQRNKKNFVSIGMALNEGYTEYLNQKYFDRECLDDGYYHEQAIAQEIEKIVGDTTMEQLYFNGDLYGLIQELSKYANLEEVINLLKDFDKLHYKATEEEKKDKSYKDLRKRIAQIYLRKQQSLLSAGKIDLEEYKKNKLIHVDIFVNEEKSFDLGADLSIDGNKIQIIDSNVGIYIATNADSYLNSNPDEIVDIGIKNFVSRDSYSELKRERHRG